MDIDDPATSAGQLNKFGECLRRHPITECFSWSSASFQSLCRVTWPSGIFAGHRTLFVPKGGVVIRRNSKHSFGDFAPGDHSSGRDIWYAVAHPGAEELLKHRTEFFRVGRAEP